MWSERTTTVPRKAPAMTAGPGASASLTLRIASLPSRGGAFGAPASKHTAGVAAPCNVRVRTVENDAGGGGSETTTPSSNNLHSGIGGAGGTTVTGFAGVSGAIVKSSEQDNSIVEWQLITVDISSAMSIGCTTNSSDRGRFAGGSSATGALMTQGCRLSCSSVILRSTSICKRLPMTSLAPSVASNLPKAPIIVPADTEDSCVPSVGNRPAKSTYNKTPKLQRSARKSCMVPLARTSGAMYLMEPTVECATLMPSPTTFDRPKSDIFTSQRTFGPSRRSLTTKMFSSLRSR
mmetsp:Transcript_57290/g.166236  ORF Transcript_57290/g.166236 Transcript_57290/m.166236 type:complete len:292 (-) Transcript_57290:583-1458(-)